MWYTLYILWSKVHQIDALSVKLYIFYEGAVPKNFSSECVWNLCTPSFKSLSLLDVSQIAVLLRWNFRNLSGNHTVYRHTLYLDNPISQFDWIFDRGNPEIVAQYWYYLVQLVLIHLLLSMRRICPSNIHLDFLTYSNRESIAAVVLLLPMTGRFGQWIKW